jgi:hypothetical protein
MRLLIGVLLASALAGSTLRGQDFARADAETVRLKPAVFERLPPPVRQELERRGCVVPQAYSDKVPHNVVRGRFTSGAQTDIAVLCSRQRVSVIMVFRGGTTASVSEVAKRPDADFLQVVGEGGVVGFSRAVGTADPRYIQEHHRRYGGPTPPRLDHDGINDIFVGKASVVWYWSEGKWLQLQGAD